MIIIIIISGRNDEIVIIIDIMVKNGLSENCHSLWCNSVMCLYYFINSACSRFIKGHSLFKITNFLYKNNTNNEED